MTEASQGTGPSFVVAGARVVEHESSVLQVASGQLGFYACLSCEKPVEGGVELIDLRILHPEFLGQRGGVPEPGGGELGAGSDESLRDHGQYEFAFAAGLGSDQRRHPELAHDAQDGFDVAMRARAGDDEDVLGADQLLSAEEAAQALDLLRGPVGEVGESALANVALFAPGLSEKDRGWRVAVGDALDDSERRLVLVPAERFGKRSVGHTAALGMVGRGLNVPRAVDRRPRRRRRGCRRSRGRRRRPGLLSPPSPAPAGAVPRACSARSRVGEHQHCREPRRRPPAPGPTWPRPTAQKEKAGPPHVGPAFVVRIGFERYRFRRRTAIATKPRPIARTADGSGIGVSTSPWAV